MKRRSSFITLFPFIVIVLFFFYPIFSLKIPFPGDLLVGHYAPYTSNAYGSFGPGSVPHKAQGPDVITQLFPWKYFVIERLKKGSIPFWNPHQFSGTPQLSDFQSGAFYPLNIIFFFFNFLDGWTLFILSAPLLTLLFTYLYLREIGLSKIPSAFSGIVFAFSSYMVVWVEYGNITHTLLYLPVVLYCIEKLMKHYDTKWVSVLLLSLVFSFLAGYIQGYFYLTAVAVVYYLGKKILRNNISFRQTAYCGLLFCLPILLTMFQLLPTLLLFSHSSRTNYSLDQIQHLLNPVWYTITVLVPDFFGHPASRNQWIPVTYIERVSYFGFIPFILAIFAIISSWKSATVKIMTVIFLVTFFVSVDFFFTKFFYLLPIPVLSTTVPTRILSLFVFSGSVLAGFGLENVIKRSQLRKIAFVGAGIAIFLTALWGFVLISSTLVNNSVWIKNMVVAKRNLILPSAYFVAFGCLLFVYRKQYMRTYTLPVVLLGIGIVTVFDLFYFFHKITPFSPKEYVYPSTPVVAYLQKHAGIYRFWGYGSAYISSNFQTVDGTYSVEGIDALHLKRYTEVLESTKNGKVPALISRADANLAPGFGTSDLSANRYRKKMMNLLGIKYVLNKNDGLSEKKEADIATFHPDEYRLVWHKKPWQIYENLSVAPRFFLTNSYEVYKDDKEFFQRFYDPSFDERKTLLLREDPKLIKGDFKNKQVVLISYTPNKVSFKTKTDSPSLLFLSDTYYPEWKVKVDEKKEKLFIADYAFRAVVVPKGEHTVTFFYEPQSFRTGLVISIVSLLFTFVLLSKVRIKTL